VSPTVTVPLFAVLSSSGVLGPCGVAPNEPAGLDSSGSARRKGPARTSAAAARVPSRSQCHHRQRARASVAHPSSWNLFFSPNEPAAATKPLRLTLFLSPISITSDRVLHDVVRKLLISRRSAPTQHQFLSHDELLSFAGQRLYFLQAVFLLFMVIIFALSPVVSFRLQRSSLQLGRSNQKVGVGKTMCTEGLGHGSSTWPASKRRH